LFLSDPHIAGNPTRKVCPSSSQPFPLNKERRGEPNLSPFLFDANGEGSTPSPLRHFQNDATRRVHPSSSPFDVTQHDEKG